MIDHTARSVSLTVRPPSGQKSKARITHYRIDKTHGNAYTAWKNMGSPAHLTAEQKQLLQKKDDVEQLVPATEMQFNEHALELNFDLPGNAVSLIEVAWLN